eukprot:4697643-Pyramimonas_sp.AAC.1
MGDIIMQPAENLGGRNPSPARTSGWTGLGSTRGLRHLNSIVGEAPPVTPTHPIRGQRLLLRPGDTHHAPGNARSRCIDVAHGSAPALGVARVHNGISCRGDGG